MKILLSWMAFKNDFDIKFNEAKEFKPGDFTGTLHSDIYKQGGYEKHILLTTKPGSEGLAKRCNLLKHFIKDTYPEHVIDFAHLNIAEEDLQNFSIIESTIRSYLQTFEAGEEIHVIAGTGPTALTMVWSSLWISMKNRFRLFLIQRSSHTDDGKRSRLVEICPYTNVLLDNKLMEVHFNKALPKNIYSDELVEKEYQKAHMIAQASDVNVLVLGETGCGKDVLAKFIYTNSPLHGKPYRAINCASLPDEVLYSELFGHEKGSFTGAVNKRVGLFEECNSGTLFLDEIGDISPFMQQSLLRAIENKEIKLLGSNTVIENVIVRIIAATNNDLYEKCKAGKFRWDLYYRLCTMEICLEPYRNRPLKERQKILKHYFGIAEKKWKTKVKLTKEAEKIMECYSFPGNFREIYNTTNGLFALGKSTIEAADLPKRFFDVTTAINETYEAALRKHCLAIFEKYKKDLAATCKALGYKNQTQLKQKLLNWGEQF